MNEPNVAAQLGPCPECDELVWGRREFRTLGSVPSFDRDHCKVPKGARHAVVYFHEPAEGQ